MTEPSYVTDEDIQALKWACGIVGELGIPHTKAVYRLLNQIVAREVKKATVRGKDQ